MNIKIMKSKLILLLLILIVNRGGTNAMAQEFTIYGVKQSAQVGSFMFTLAGVTLEESDLGAAINLSMQLVDSKSVMEEFYLTVPASSRKGSVQNRFGVITLKGVEGLDQNFYNSPEKIIWRFEFLPDSTQNIKMHFSRSKQTIPWDPESHSLILNSKVIFSFTCISLSPRFDIDDMPSGYNPWHLKGTIQKIFKGQLGKEEGASFESEVTIYLGLVRARPVGIWFGFDPFELPQPGESWVIFCNPKDEIANPEDFLRGKGEGCTAFRSKEVNKDLDLTAKIFASNLALKPSLKLAKENIRTAGPLFYSYLWEQFGEAAVKDSPAFEQILSILENAILSSTSRSTLINDMESFFGMRDGTSGIQKAGDRFIVSLFRLLKQKESENSDFHYNLLGTNIPNLLGINSGLTKRSANQVFSGRAKDRREAVRTLKVSPHKKEAGVLLQWIQH